MNVNNKNRSVGMLISLICVSAFVAVFFVEPIAQDSAYHNFADTNEFFGIANFWNVVSNIPFLIVGLMGLAQLKRLNIIPEMGVAYWLLFFGVALVAFGSGYYHLNPNNKTLVWDRLPMTIAFMSLFAVIIAEFVNQQRGSLLLFPLLIAGIASVLFWLVTESQGAGDLRFYALVQFLPIILIPLILFAYPSGFTKVSAYWWLLFAYIVAKLLEYFDGAIYQFFNQQMSGHALKHVAAAVGMYVLLRGFRHRLTTATTKN
jgi:hypothetical protein